MWESGTKKVKPGALLCGGKGTKINEKGQWVKWAFWLKQIRGKKRQATSYYTDEKKFPSTPNQREQKKK